MSLNDKEVRQLADQLYPLADQLKALFYMVGWHIEPWRYHKLGVSFDRNRQQFVYMFSDVDPAAPGIALGVPVPSAAAWDRVFLATETLGATPISARVLSYPNNASVPLDITLSEQVEVQEGVQSVHTDQEQWGSEFGVDAGLSTEVSASGGAFGVSVSAKVSASINTSYSKSKSGSQEQKDTTSESEKTTRLAKANFSVPPHTDLTVTITYDEITVRMPYRDALNVDMSIRSVGEWYVASWDVQGQYHEGNTWGGDGMNWASLDNFLSGYFGAHSASNDFADGLDVTFSNDWRDVQVREQVDKIRASYMRIQREGYVLYGDASEFRFKTDEKAIE